MTNLLSIIVIRVQNESTCVSFSFFMRMDYNLAIETEPILVNFFK